MVPTSALVVDDVQRVFDDIERQFELDTHSLVALTNAFLDELSRGLANYGQPMAMMCVHFIPITCTAHNVVMVLRSPTFVTGVPDGSEKG